MLLLTEIIQEIHKSEFVSSGLRKLYQQYKDHPNIGKLYVNFSDTASDPIMKAPVWQPKGHQDPVGVYAYPLGYVLEFIDKIPYAGDRKYIRVIEDKSKKKLVLNDIKSFLTVYKLLKDKYNPKILGRYEDIYPGRIKEPNKPAKLFFQAVQARVDAIQKQLVDRIREPLEQTHFLTSLGYDAIEDESETSDEAIINSNEPRQIIFLKRNAFDVVDVLEQKREGDITKRFFQKIISKVSEEVGIKPTRRYEEEAAWVNGWFRASMQMYGYDKSIKGIEVVGNGYKSCLYDFWRNWPGAFLRGDSSYAGVQKTGLKYIREMGVLFTTDESIFKNKEILERKSVIVFISGYEGEGQWYSKEKLSSIEMNDLVSEIPDHLIGWTKGKVIFMIKDFYGGEQEFSTTMPKFVENNFNNEFTVSIYNYLMHLADIYREKKEKEERAA